MICPYIVTRKTVRQCTSDHNDDGEEVSGEVIEYNEAIPFACAEKDALRGMMGGVSIGVSR